MLRKSSLVLHLGHFGSTSESITYIRHRRHPTSSIGWGPPITPPLIILSSASDDTHEPPSIISDDISDPEFHVQTPSSGEFGLIGGDKFSSTSSFGLAVVPLPLILVSISLYFTAYNVCTHNQNQNLKKTNSL